MKGQLGSPLQEDLSREQNPRRAAAIIIPHQQQQSSLDDISAIS